MNNSLLMGAVLGVTVAAAGGVFAGYKMLGTDDAGPAVVQHGSAQPAQPECVPYQPHDKNRLAGAYAGNQIQKRIQENRNGC